MATFLKDIRVQFISLVKNGANGKTIIFKSADKEDFQHVRQVSIAKRDEAKRMVYGIVYAPDSEDTQGDMTNAEEIEKAAHQFMADLNARQVDKGHDYDPKDGVFVAESWIVRKSDPLFPAEPAGSWAVGIKVNNDEIWQQVEKGEIQGLSMAGEALRIVQKAADFNSVQSISGLWGELDSLHQAIRSILEDEAIEDKGAAIGTSIDQFKAYLQGRFQKSDTKPGFFARFFKKEKGDSEMTKEEVTAIVKESVTAAVQEAMKDRPAPIAKGDLETMISGAVETAVKPLTERIEAIEKQTPGSGQQGGGDGLDGEDVSGLAQYV